MSATSEKIILSIWGAHVIGGLGIGTYKGYLKGRNKYYGWQHHHMSSKERDRVYPDNIVKHGLTGISFGFLVIPFWLYLKYNIGEIIRAQQLYNKNIHNWKANEIVKDND